MSGGDPPSMRLLRTVSWLEGTLSMLIVIPDAFANSASDAVKFASSPPVHWTWMLTFLPFNGWSAPRAWSSSLAPVALVGTAANEAPGLAGVPLAGASEPGAAEPG